MTFTPARSGDIARAVWVRKQGGSGMHATGVLIAERITDTVLLVAALGVALALSKDLPRGLALSVGR